MNQNFTQITKTLMDSYTNRFSSFFCREDFIDAIERLKRAKPDNRRFLMKELSQLCEIRGIDPAELNNNPRILLSIPSKTDLETDILKAFYEMRREIPGAKEVMERIVRRCKPEFASDTVRVAILKTILQETDDSFKTYNLDTIKDWAKGRLSEDEKEKWEDAEPALKKQILIDQITEDIFPEGKKEKEGSKKEELSAEQIFEALEKVSDRIALAGKEEALENEKTESEAQGHQKAEKESEVKTETKTDEESEAEPETKPEAKPDKENTSFLKLTLREETVTLLADLFEKEGRDEINSSIYTELKNFCEKLDEESGPDTALSKKKKLLAEISSFMEKDFRNQFGKEKLESRNGKTMKVSELLKETKKTIKRKNRRTEIQDKKQPNQDLLKMCSELQNGTFRPNGLTKEYLYALSFFLKLKLPQRFTKREESSADPESGSENQADGKSTQENRFLPDMEKNLFHDYYSDNLIRYLSEEYQDPALKSLWENDPVSDGMNPKNSSEAIYLYYIYKIDTFDNPGVALDAANKTIRKLQRLHNPKQEKPEDKKKPGKKKKEEPNVQEREFEAAEATQAEGKVAEFKEANHDSPISEQSKKRQAFYTAEYMDLMQILLKKKEDEVADFVFQNFAFDLADKGKPKMMEAYQTRQARNFMLDIIRLVDEGFYTSGGEGPLEQLEDCQNTLLERFESMYPHEEDFLLLIRKFNEKLSRSLQSLFFKEDRENMARLLFFLLEAEKEKAIYSDYRLKQKFLDKTGIEISTRTLSRYVKALQELGFDLEKAGSFDKDENEQSASSKKDKSNKKKEAAVKDKDKKKEKEKEDLKGIRLNPQNCSPECHAMLSVLSTVYFHYSKALDEQLEKMLEDQFLQQRISRTQLLSLYYTYYVLQIILEVGLDTEWNHSFKTFAEIYEDFTSSVNPYLEDSRYQPFSEKNIFDVYILLCLYFFALQISLV